MSVKFGNNDKTKSGIIEYNAFIIDKESSGTTYCKTKFYYIRHGVDRSGCWF